MPFEKCYLDVLTSLEFQAQPAVGKSPLSWAEMLGIADSPDLDRSMLPNVPVSRAVARAYCLGGGPVLHGYVVAMAWGNQAGGPGGRANARNAWARRHDIASLLTRLRRGRMTRRESYDLFAEAAIPGLGPAYFTKLLYFFCGEAGSPADRYIMDKWTSRSINLLTNQHVVRMDTAGYVASQNTGENYEYFCTEVDRLADVLNKQRVGRPSLTSDEVEQMIFSSGADGRRERGAWRAHVFANWDLQKPAHRYRSQELRDWAAMRTLS